MMLIGQKPSGSKDPFALRRQALGIIRLVISHKLDIRLDELLTYACSLHDELQYDIKKYARIIDFISSRAQYYFKEQYQHDVVLSAVNLRREPNILIAKAKLEAASEFMQEEDGKSLIGLYKRCSNILGNEKASTSLDEGLLQLEPEQKLLKKLNEIEPKLKQYIAAKDFVPAMNALLSLHKVVADFFGKVMVNSDDAKLAAARKSLIAKVKATCNLVLDFDQLQ